MTATASVPTASVPIGTSNVRRGDPRTSDPASGITPRRRPVVPRAVSFATASIAFAALFFAAGALTPLLVVLEHEWDFAPAQLTIAFAVYAVGLIISLVVVGGLSDHLGRRPVLAAALLVAAGTMVVFVVAPDIEWIIVARLVQGLATGAATGALTAWIVELAPDNAKRIGAVVAAASPAGGLALGALVSGLAVEAIGDARIAVYSALGVVLLATAVIAFFSRETVSRRAGALRSLRPVVAVPRSARAALFAAAPAIIGSWMLGGLFLGLVPSLVRDVFGVDSGAIAGLSVFLQPAPAAVAGVLLARLAPRRGLLLGLLAVLVGVSLDLVALSTTALPLLWIGAVFGGFGFGVVFSAAVRLVAPLVEAHERGELFSVVYLLAYVSFGVPTLIAGQLVALVGLQTIAIAYAVLVALVVAVGLVLQIPRVRRTRAA